MKRENINTITSLRFFAAAAIVFGHSVGYHGIPAGWAGNFAHYQGVSFFFVLSGFVLKISYPELRDRSSKFRFLVARFARIWPLHLFAFGLFCLIKIANHEVLWPSSESISEWITPVLNLSLLHAWSPFYAQSMSYNAVSWSISVELFFYVSFIWLIKIPSSKWYFLPIIGLVPAIALIGWTHWMKIPIYPENGYALSISIILYTNPASRLFEFTLGMAAASIFERFRDYRVSELKGGILEIFAIGLLWFAFFVMNFSAFEVGPISQILAPSICIWLERCGAGPLFACVIFIFAFQGGFVSRLLQNSFYVLLGEISFATYMLHQLLQGWVTAKVVGPQSMVFALYLLLVLICSYLAWRYVENPARSWIRKKL